MIRAEDIKFARWQREGVERKVPGGHAVVHECETFPGLGLAFVWKDRRSSLQWLWQGKELSGGLAGAVATLNQAVAEGPA